MKVTIHQPNFLPYLGFFEKILYSDVFVIYDTAQFSRDGFQQRNFIKLGDGKHLCCLQVGSDAWHHPIKDVAIKNDIVTQKMWKTISLAYRKAPYFHLYREELEALFLSHPTNLSDFSTAIIRYVLEKLHWTGTIVRTSELPMLDPSLRKTDALLQIVQAVGGSVYVSGSSGKNYLEEHKFTAAGIEVVYQAFRATPYPQLGSEFIPNLAVLDWLFNAPIDSLQFQYKFDRREALGQAAPA